MYAHIAASGHPGGGLGVTQYPVAKMFRIGRRSEPHQEPDGADSLPPKYLRRKMSTSPRGKKSGVPCFAADVAVGLRVLGSQKMRPRSIALVRGPQKWCRGQRAVSHERLKGQMTGCPGTREEVLRTELQSTRCLRNVRRVTWAGM